MVILHLSLNCHSQGVISSWMSYHVDVIVASLWNSATPALAVVRLFPKLKVIAGEVWQITDIELCLIVTQIFVVFVLPGDLHSQSLALSHPNHVAVMRLTANEVFDRGRIS